MSRLQQRIFFFLAGAILLIFVACQIPATTEAAPIAQAAPTAIQLPPLPYSYNALEPYIDATTMQLHHDKHHAAYVEKLNQAFQQYPELRDKDISLLVSNLNSVPEQVRTVIRNNGGGHLNHSMFWQIMAPNAGGPPTGAIATAINQNFGSFDTFKQQFNKAGADRFGSGWAWLVRTPQGRLQIISTANQDSPLMVGAYPIMGNDVWEHAYYLKYQNRRAEYLTNWWNVVNWTEVNRRFAQATASRPQPR